MIGNSTVHQTLQIYDPRERWLVRAADVLLSPIGWLRSPRPVRPVSRILLLRLERIGDLLMAIDAIQDARAAWPDAEIDLAVGAWNESLAQLIPGVTEVQVLTAPWLSRGPSEASWRTIVARARNLKSREYDLVLNFEPDIRSNALSWLTGAKIRVGYSSGGGRAFLTDAGPYDPSVHASANARRLVVRAVRSSATGGRLPEPGVEHQADLKAKLPPDSLAAAEALLAGAREPLIGLHVSGGRLSKQWHLDRFGSVARILVERHRGTIVLTGDLTDRPMVDEVRNHLQHLPVVDASGTPGLVDLAALLSRLDVLVTSDTGPMHLAAAVGTPVVALFGPSHPERYGPMGPRHRVLRVDLPCSPCGQVRLPPERCRGHVPDCMDAIHVETVVTAVGEMLAGSAPPLGKQLGAS